MLFWSEGEQIELQKNIVQGEEGSGFLEKQSKRRKKGLKSGLRPCLNTRPYQAHPAALTAN